MQVFSTLLIYANVSHHLGAGTILDCLKMKKPLLCVINNSLMNNHQSELLNQLKKEKFIFGIEGPEFLKSQVKQYIQLNHLLVCYLFLVGRYIEII